MKKSYKVLATLAITSVLGLSSMVPYQITSAAVVFTDNQSASAYQKAIQSLSEQNIVSGYGNQQFKPYQHVTRAELAKMVALALSVPEKQLTFEDAAAGDWFYSYVSALVNIGAMKVEGGKFHPHKHVTHGELADLVAAVLKVDAGAVKALLGSAYSANKQATRGEAALVVNAAQQIAPIQVTSIRALNTLTLQVTFSKPLPKEDVDVAKVKEHVIFDNDLKALNNAQLKTGATVTYIIPTTTQKAGTTYSLSYKGQQGVKFEGSGVKLNIRSAQQVAADTFEIESFQEDGVVDYGYIIAAYSGGRKGAFVVDDNNVYNGKQYQVLSSMRDKKVQITPEGGETMTASYIPFTQATDGRQAPKFRLPNGQTFKAGVKYTVTADWATIVSSTFTAKEIAPLSIQSAEQVSETSLTITLAQDPKDELFAFRSVTLTPANGGTPLTAQYKLTSRKGATGTFDIQNGGKLTAGTTYTVAPVGNWATAANITLTSK